MSQSEQLRETVQLLERENEALRMQNRDNQALLKSLESLLGVEIDDDPFSSVFRSLVATFDFRQAMVLSESDPGEVECIAATREAFVGQRFHSGMFFEKVLAGRVSATLSNRDIAEWRQMSGAAAVPDHSGLYLPLNVPDRRGMLVMLKPAGDSGFDRRHVALGRKFSLVASHALAARQARQLIRENEARAHAAEETSRIKDRFLSHFSHELKTPLNAVIGFSDIIANGQAGPVDNDQYREFIGYIQEGAHKLLGLINDVLLVSDIESGRFSISLESFPLGEMVQDALRTLQDDVLNHDVQIDCDGSSMAVCADRWATRHVLEKIIGNAIRFSPSGTSVQVRCGKAGDRVQVAVTDSGCGIPDDILRQIGSSFIVSDKVLTREQSGSGLGLATSYGLARLMGVEIAIESRLGNGTTVTVSFDAGSKRILDDVPPESLSARSLA